MVPSRFIRRTACLSALGVLPALTFSGHGLPGAWGQVRPGGAVLPVEPAGEPRVASGRLVNHNPEVRNDLDDAARLAAKGDFPQALLKYEALMQTDADAVYPIDTHRFIAVTEKVQREIGRLPLEGLRLYRASVDAEASRLYEQGRAGDLSALLKIAMQYRHSTVGADAVDLAASRLFDRAEFARAARLWERWREEYTGASAEKRAGVAAQLAIAYVHSGQPEKAARLVAELTANTADVNVVVGGRRVAAAAFAENFLKNPTVIVGRRHALVGGPGDRPMWAGNPAGTHLMSDGRPTLEQRYIDNEEALRNPERPFNRTRIELQRFGGRAPTALEPERPIPAAADGVLYIRYADRVRALDLISGRLKWDSPHVYVEPTTDNEPAAQGPQNGAIVAFAATSTGRSMPETLQFDRGRSAITVADGRVFTVESFMGSGSAQPYYPQRGNQTVGGSLTARDARTGKVLWSIGNGLPKPAAGKEPTEEQTRPARATYLTAPTYSQGRLLVIAEHGENYWGMCLEPADGSPVWIKKLSAKPVLPQNAAWYTMGSPPAAAGGVAYFLTNAMTLAALDEATGQVQWILQYADPPRPEGAGGRFNRGAAINPYAGLGRPPNPIVVAGSRVIVLPSDSDKVLAVNTIDGSIAWQASREATLDDGSRTTQTWLAGVVGGKVVLCGPDATALDVESGKTVWTSRLNARGAGRPALSEKLLALSVEDEGVWVLNPADGTAAALDAPSAPTDAVGRRSNPLGNLLLVDGKLTACSEVASAVYYKFDLGFEQLTARIAAAGNDPRPYVQRGELCFRSLSHDPVRLLEQARADFEKARELAAGGAATAELRSECDAALYQVYFHIADRTADPVERVAMLDKAIAVAAEDRQKAEVRLELARTYREHGDPVKAADYAQDLALSAPEVSVDIADRARRLSRSITDPRPTQTGLKVSQDFIASLIAAHGRSVYARHDAKAVELFRKATAEKSVEKLQDLLRAYSHAAIVPDCLLQLGIFHSQLARAASAAGDADPTQRRLTASSQLARAAQWLERLAFAREYKDSPLRAGAVAGRLAIGEQRSRAEAREWFARLAKFEPTAAVNWPDYAGKNVREVMDEVGRRLYPNGVPARLIVSGMAFDLAGDIVPGRLLEGSEAGAERWGGRGSRLLPGVDGRPVTAEDGVFLLTPRGLCFVKPATGELVWRCVEGKPSSGSPAFNRFVTAVGALVDDKLVFWDGVTACAVDIETGKLTSQMETYSEMGVGQDINLRRRGVFLQPQGAVGFHNGLMAYYKVVPDGNSMRFKLKVLDLPNDRAMPEIDLSVNAVNFFNGRMPAPVVGEAGVAAVTGFNTFAVFRPTTGKQLFQGTVGGAITGLHMTPDDILLATTQGAGAYAFDAAGKQLWHVPSLGGGADMAVLLTTDSEHVYLSMFRQVAGGGEVLAAVLRDGTIRWRLPMNKIDAGRPNFGFRNAMSGAVADGRLVLLTSINGWPQPQVPPQQIYQQFPVAVCVNAADGKEVWKRPLEQGVQKHGPVGPPAFTPTQAVISVRDSQNMSTRLNVLERETGNFLINNKSLTGPYTNGDARWQLAWQSGFPQVVGSYLLVETPDGVMVWSSR